MDTSEDISGIAQHITIDNLPFAFGLGRPVSAINILVHSISPFTPNFTMLHVRLRISSNRSSSSLISRKVLSGRTYKSLSRAQSRAAWPSRPGCSCALRVRGRY